MRIAKLLTLPLLAALTVVPAAASAQARISISFGTRLGPSVGISAYSADRMGDYRNNYRRWTPVTLYDVNGRYYRNNVRGARPVLVYRYNNEYFFPPQDQGWNGIDRRYNYSRRPNDSDYGRTSPYDRDAFTFDARLGAEIGVLAYSQDRAGDWRMNVRRWTPVTVYEYHGRYYQNSIPGTRAVGMYRYQNEYFLPPDDEAWVGTDRRFNYSHRPSREDYGRVRGFDRDGRDDNNGRGGDNGRGRGRGGL